MKNIKNYLFDNNINDKINLSTIISNELDLKNLDRFCRCGNRQSHKLIYCSRCGSKFENGYKPDTVGERIKWLLDKPNRNCQYPPRYYAAIILRSVKKQMGDKDITIDDITNEIEKQIKLL